MNHPHAHGNSTYGTCLAWKGNNEGGWDHKLGFAIAWMTSAHNFYFNIPTTKHNCQLILKLISWMGIVHPHLSCEHVDGIHIVKKQKSVDIKLLTLQQEKSLTI
jgi:hypothetical protein